MGLRLFQIVERAGEGAAAAFAQTEKRNRPAAAGAAFRAAHRGRHSDPGAAHTRHFHRARHRSISASPACRAESLSRSRCVRMRLLNRRRAHRALLFRELHFMLEGALGMIRRGRAAFEGEFPLRAVDLHDVNGRADPEQHVHEDADEKEIGCREFAPRASAAGERRRRFARYSIQRSGQTSPPLSVRDPQVKPASGRSTGRGGWTKSRSARGRLAQR